VAPLAAQTEEATAREALPVVRPPTPTQRPSVVGGGGSKVSYQGMPRVPESPNDVAGTPEVEASPMPRRPRPRVGGSAVTQSAPAAPGSALSATGKCRELMQAQAHSQRLLGAIFEMTITEEAAVSIMDTYPELVWLANCLQRCPLPPGWTAAEGNGNMRYIDMGSGQVTEVSPVQDRVAELGRLMLQWRRSPSSVSYIADGLGAKADQFTEEAVRQRKVWLGPHKDPDTGLDFWHCAATDCSTWGEPGMASDFLARVAERLKSALPVPEAKSKGLEAPASTAQSAPSPPAAPAPPASPVPPASARSDGGHAKYERGASAGAGRREDHDDEDRRQPPLSAQDAPDAPRTPYTPRSSRGRPVRKVQATSMDALEQSEKENGCAGTIGLKEVADEIRDDLAQRGKRLEQPPSRETSSDGRSNQRVAPGDTRADTLTSEVADVYTRPECRRRRTESSERLNPLDAHSATDPSYTEEPAAQQGVATDADPGEGRLPPPPPPPSAASGDVRPRSRHGMPLQSVQQQSSDLSQTLGGVAEAELQDAVTLGSPRAAAQGAALPPRPRIAPGGQLGATGGFGSAGAGQQLGATGGLKRPSTGKKSGAPGGLERPGTGKKLGSTGGLARPGTGKKMGSTGGLNSTGGAKRMGSTGGLGCTSEMGATGGFGGTGMIKEMCIGAIAAAMDDAFGSDAEDNCIEGDSDSCCSLEQCEDAEEDAEDAAPMSPSLISICGPSSPAPRHGSDDEGSPRADSPSILVLDDAGPPLWTSCKRLALPQVPEAEEVYRPQTPPRSARGPKSARGDRPILLGVPAPLSARARCGPGDAPLSARGPRPGARRHQVGGA